MGSGGSRTDTLVDAPITPPFDAPMEKKERSKQMEPGQPVGSLAHSPSRRARSAAKMRSSPPAGPARPPSGSPKTSPRRRSEVSACETSLGTMSVRSNSDQSETSDCPFVRRDRTRYSRKMTLLEIHEARMATDGQGCPAEANSPGTLIPHSPPSKQPSSALPSSLPPTSPRRRRVSASPAALPQVHAGNGSPRSSPRSALSHELAPRGPEHTTPELFAVAPMIELVDTKPAPPRRRSLLADALLCVTTSGTCSRSPAASDPFSLSASSLGSMVRGTIMTGTVKDLLSLSARMAASPSGPSGMADGLEEHDIAAH